MISLDELQEQIAEFEDYVQSTDIAAMQSMCDLSVHVHLLTMPRTLGCPFRLYARLLKHQLMCIYL